MKLQYMPAFVLAILTLAGCVKVQIPMTNSIAGTIIDEQSMRPIQGATVFYSEYPEQKVVTGSDGRFELFAKFKERWSFPFPTDHHPAEQNVTVLGTDGFESKTTIGNSTSPMFIKLRRVHSE